MKRVITGLVIAYVVLGVDNPAAKDCRTSVTVVDQAKWVAFATPIWPLFAPKVLDKLVV